MKKFLNSVLGFSRKECQGVFILCLFLVLAIFIPIVHRRLQKLPVYNFSEFEQEIKIFQASVRDTGRYTPANRKNISARPTKKITYNKFDPNGLSETQWLELGLSDRQIKVIKNYESKGGRFYSKEDVKKIYSIRPDQYAQLEPYICIPPRKKHSSSTTSKSRRAIVNINEADSVMLESIYGIGPAFASRIIKYRNRLGGFHRIEQLREVYGLDSAKYDQIKNQVNSAGMIRKININTSAFDDLRKHPYLSYRQAQVIIQYRNEHGNYADMRDVAKVIALNAETLDKMEPYLDF